MAKVTKKGISFKLSKKNCKTELKKSKKVRKEAEITEGKRHEVKPPMKVEVEDVDDKKRIEKLKVVKKRRFKPGKGAIEKVGAKIKKETGKLKKFVKRGASTLKKLGKERRQDRGVVYVSNIPYGFYEEGLKDYFTQFGIVTGVNMPRSETGKSRGYAFVEFFHADVAKVAAETMNNYLMMGRLLKAQLVPSEQQRPHAFRTRFVTNEKIKQNKIKKHINIRNKVLSKAQEEKLKEKILEKINNIKKKFREKGIDYEIQVGYDSDALLTGLKTLDPDNPDSMQDQLQERKKSLQKIPSKLEIAAEKVIRNTSSAIQKVRKLNKKLAASNEPKVTLRKVKSVSGKIGKKVKKKVGKSEIKRMKLETDV